MASRSSGNFNSEFYKGTRRGRSGAGDFGHEMFPEKYEATPMNEDPAQIYEHNRDILRDYTPDNNNLMAHEETRRNNYSRSRINLRDGGKFGSTADPWQNEEFDTQFHDKDPRGWSTEQNWKEYRRHLEAQLNRTDFKDDGDYSVTGGGIHPNTLYKQVRGAQNWVKSRLKIFSTAWEGKHTGGAGIYGQVSKVFKSEHEDSSVLVDGTGMAQTFEDPVNRQRATTRLSNWVHGGSKALRANTTSDHRVKVASYGKLMRQRGLINHENQLRLVSDDTHWSLIEGQQAAPRNLVTLMSSIVSGKTAAEVARHDKHDSHAAPADSERFRGNKYSEKESTTRNNILTRDIVALLGITINEVKFLESRARTNNKSADMAIANLYNMAEAVHRAPAHIKLQIRDELLIKSAGQGLSPAGPGNIRSNRNEVVVNPRILQYMDLMVKKTTMPGDTWANKMQAIGDPDDKLDKWLTQTPLFVTKSKTHDGEDIVSVFHEGLQGQTTKDGKATHSYRSVAAEAQLNQKNRQEGMLTTLLDTTTSAQTRKTRDRTADDYYSEMMHAEIDNEFGENKALTRHIAPLGNKHAGRNQIREDHNPTRREIVADKRVRKNPATRTHLTR